MTLYSPLALLFLLTVPAVIVLYLLKQRHRDYTVSSLYLWDEALKDLEANAPWQKLKKNLLMVLQIMLMVLLAFALSRPFLNTGANEAGNYVIVIDTSFNMQATDVAPNRFEAAKKEALNFIKNLRPKSLVTLVSMGGGSVIEENLSSDRNKLIEKINSLKVTNSAVNLDDAANLLRSVARQYPGTAVALFGSHELKVPGVDISFSNLSGNGDNYAVLLLSHALSGKNLTALARIANYGKSSATLPVSLYADGNVLDAKNVSLDPGEVSTVYWNSIPESTRTLECRIEKKDSLDADNHCWDSVNPIKTGRVMLATEKNIFVEKALSLMNNIRLYKTTPTENTGLKNYDLYIFDGFLPEKLPTDGSLMIINPPANNLFKVDGEIEQPVLKKSTHELFKYINDFTFTIGKAKKMVLPNWARTVLDSREGPVIFAGALENRRIIVLGFDLHNSDMVLKPAFPIMMSNVLEWLIPSRIKNIESVYPGQDIDFNLDPKAGRVRVITPSGKAADIAPPFPAATYTGTGEIGQYILEQTTSDGTLYHYFSVNAPAQKDSNLIAAAADSPQDSKTAAPQKRVGTGFSLQAILLWLAILVLAIEWWVYSNGI